MSSGPNIAARDRIQTMPIGKAEMNNLGETSAKGRLSLFLCMLQQQNDIAQNTFQQRCTRPTHTGKTPTIGKVLKK